tara:strand:+ start:888 stop:1823 length:936 start_codon:yes stop_codon:yes gene_type:complete
MNVLKLLPFFYKNVIQKNASVKICVAFVTALSILVGKLFRSAADNQSQIISAVLRTVRNTANSQLWFSAVPPSPLIARVKRGFFFHPHQIHNKQSGFTMLELIIVVAILAVIAGSAVMAFRDVEPNAQNDVAKFEMGQIAGAIDAYIRDGNKWPDFNAGDRYAPADLTFLFEQGDNADWSIDYRRGWRGPYLKRASEEAEIGNGLDINGDGNPLSGPQEIHLVVRDPFMNHKNPSRPYQLLEKDFESTPGDLKRIVSLGSNGVYELPCDVDEINTDNEAYCSRNRLCTSGPINISDIPSLRKRDDLVLCLK